MSEQSDKNCKYCRGLGFIRNETGGRSVDIQCFHDGTIGFEGEHGRSVFAYDTPTPSVSGTTSRAERAEKRLLWLVQNIDPVELEAVVGGPCVTIGEAIDRIAEKSQTAERDQPRLQRYGAERNALRTVAPSSTALAPKHLQDAVRVKRETFRVVSPDNPMKMIDVVYAPTAACIEREANQLRAQLAAANLRADAAREACTAEKRTTCSFAPSATASASPPEKPLWGTGWIHGNNYKSRARELDMPGSDGEPWYIAEDGTKWSSFDVTYRPDQSSQNDISREGGTK